jgi:hypothetical protein
MKLRTRIAAVLGGLVLAAGLGVATSGPASALTTRQDISYEGGGFYLESLPKVGAQVAFSDANDTSWDYQAEGSAGGDGTFYYLHPHGYESLCMTASTAPGTFGIIKIETCVAAQQQYWWNPHNSSGYYQLFNAFWSAFLDDPNGTSPVFATLTRSCNFGNNGCTFSEPA